MFKSTRLIRPVSRLIVNRLQEEIRVLNSCRQIPARTSAASLTPTPLEFSTTRYRCSKEDETEMELDLHETPVPDNEDKAWMERRAVDSRDRTRPIPVELSMAYLDSAAYKETYGDKKIWELYRRNFPGTTHPEPRTRRKCIIFGQVQSGNPCPICRDEYLVVDYRNVKLLSQFLTDYNRQIISMPKCGVCREQYKKLMIAIEKARDYGYLDVDADFVEYDYDKYRPHSISSS